MFLAMISAFIKQDLVVQAAVASQPLYQTLKRKTLQKMLTYEENSVGDYL